ncbi:MAG: DPP IV N-terminal domain-containing protein [Gemmatimonadetes bacterium]|nr:DPP IV N-terminal domain-containing protein [Gemmatimonadota bacterium]MCY3944140.1 DPP IV N-terminal domain-containing protein [Gemmatimonadota bacterium]
MQNLRILAARAHGHIAAARRSAARRRGAGVRFTVAAAFAGLVAAACGESPLANRAPVVTDDLSGAEVFVGDSLTVDLAGHFEDPDGDALLYEAETPAAAAAEVAVAGSVLTVTALAWGEAVVTVTAHDPEGLAADQAFTVTVAPGLRQLPGVGFGGGHAPAWSPDGARIAFNSFGDGRIDIYVSDADGSDVERLTNDGADDGWPTWSPDGARIAFTSTRDGNADIYVMNADGSDVERLTDDSGIDWFAAWSPDGARIAFQSDRDGNTAIYVMNADGSDVERLTNNSADWWPAWSPDGARIAFASDRDTNGKWREIYVMNADGGDVERLTDGYIYGAWDPAWSPGGTEIAFERNRVIYVAHIAVR